MSTRCTITPYCGSCAWWVYWVAQSETNRNRTCFPKESTFWICCDHVCFDKRNRNKFISANLWILITILCVVLLICCIQLHFLSYNHILVNKNTVRVQKVSKTSKTKPNTTKDTENCKNKNMKIMYKNSRFSQFFTFFQLFRERQNTKYWRNVMRSTFRLGTALIPILDLAHSAHFGGDFRRVAGLGS